MKCVMCDGTGEYEHQYTLDNDPETAAVADALMMNAPADRLAHRWWWTEQARRAVKALDAFRKGEIA